MHQSLENYEPKETSLPFSFPQVVYHDEGKQTQLGSTL